MAAATIIHIETATEVCSVAISEGPNLTALVEESTPYKHTSHTTVLLTEALEKSGKSLTDVQAVSVSIGPGSYTGLRVGLAVAKGLAFGIDCPVITVDTLQALAIAAVEMHPEACLTTLSAPMIDARRMEVYTALYDWEGISIASPRSLILDPETFASYIRNGHEILLSGDGAKKFVDLQPGPGIIQTPVLCSARHLVPLAWKKFQQKDFTDTAYSEPFYLKPPNITKQKKGILNLGTSKKD